MVKLTKEQQRENVAVAYSIIGGIPDKHFHLREFCSNSVDTAVDAAHCGTIGCSLGWLSMHPYFNAQGMFLEDGEIINKDPNGNVVNDDFEKIATALFGRDAFARYFEPFGCGSADQILITQHGLEDNQYQQKTQKLLALARLKRGYDLTGRPTQVRPPKQK